MRIQRRSLLRALGGLGLFAALPSRRAGAAADRFEGPYLLTIHAGGGWDPTTFCDGKLPTETIELPYEEPGVVGNFTHAPLILKDGAVELDRVGNFLSDLGSRLTIVNGIDTQTNNHQTGTKHTWSGKSFEELPALGALFAASKLGDTQVPVAYLSTGAYDVTANLVPVTRIATPNALRAVGLPNVINPTAAPEDREFFHDQATEARIRAAASARLARVSGGPLLPVESAGVSELEIARAATAGLEELMAALPATPIDVKTAFPELGSYNDNALNVWLRAAETALHAFSSGQAAAANISMSSFDTHASHDQNQQRMVGKLLLLMRFVYRLADELGLADKLFVVVGSEFGRTPSYNAAAGKDHWNVTSMLVSGPNIIGNRVFGATDDELRPMCVDPETPTVTLPTDAEEGTRLNPAHLHRALRRAFAIEDAPVVDRFTLPVDHPMDDLFV